jgi:beta-mannanase
MDAQGVTNAYWAYVNAVRNYSISPTSVKFAPKYYPGDAWVDVIAVDAYNLYCKRKDGQYAKPWRSLATVLDPFMQYVAQHPGIPLAVAEWGSSEDPSQPGRKAQWITDAQQVFKQPAYERFVAISYWSAVSHEYAGCSMRIDTSTSALNAYKTMANDPFFSGVVT